MKRELLYSGPQIDPPRFDERPGHFTPSSDEGLSTFWPLKRNVVLLPDTT
jgi:hypothetical protein